MSGKEEKKDIKVLIIPGGTEIALEIWRSLKDCKNIKLYSAAADVSNHAPYVFARHFVVPNVNDTEFVDGLNRVLIEQDIDFVFPAHDDVIVALSQNADKIKSQIVSSPTETCLATRSKSQTYRLLAGIVPVPLLYDHIETIDQYPVFVKPDKGQGSQDTHIVNSVDQLSDLLREDRQYIVMEYLPGEEYTVDCFSDREAGLLFCGGRQRIRIRNGIAMNSKPVYNSIFMEYARAIAEKFTLHGAWFFQVKKDRRNTLKLLEIAPRIAGTMAVHRVRGVNFALLSIYEQQRMPLEVLLNDLNVEVDRSFTNRYRPCDIQFGVVYVDLDDTLILNGIVNTNLVRFLYQCINRGIRVVLLTKHTLDIGRTLRKHRIAELFDEVIQLRQSLCKADFIPEKNAILIDDSFVERKTVRDRLGILTFDCSMIEMLIDERV